MESLINESALRTQYGALTKTYIWQYDLQFSISFIVQIIIKLIHPGI